MSHYYYCGGDMVPHGPVPREALEREVNAGRLQASAYARGTEDTEWTTVSAVLARPVASVASVVAVTPTKPLTSVALDACAVVTLLVAWLGGLGLLVSGQVLVALVLAVLGTGNGLVMHAVGRILAR
jgi:hypothetical protein